jgi:hypothetical protein
MNEKLETQLREEAAGCTPTFDESLHSRTLSGVRTQRAMDAQVAEMSSPARGWWFAVPFLAAACVACTLLGLSWLASSNKPAPPIAMDTPPPISAPDARLVATVPDLVVDIESEYQAIGDDAQRLGAFFADQLKTLGNTVPSGG